MNTGEETITEFEDMTIETSKTAKQKFGKQNKIKNNKNKLGRLVHAYYSPYSRS
jgi:hypothetical protein